MLSTYEDTKISNFVLNDMTKETYDELKQNGKINSNDLYLLNNDAGDGDWEKIETITFLEDGPLDKTSDPNGTPYNFKKIMWKVFLPKHDPEISGAFIVSDTGGYTLCNLFYSTLYNGDSSAFYEMFLNNDRWDMVIGNWIKNKNATMALLGMPFNQKFQNSTKYRSNIAQLKVSSTLPKGTELEIWAVRA